MEWGRLPLWGLVHLAEHFRRRRLVEPTDFLEAGDPNRLEHQKSADSVHGPRVDRKLEGDLHVTHCGKIVNLQPRRIKCLDVAQDVLQPYRIG